jgi:two-component system OmpR family response regulator
MQTLTIDEHDEVWIDDGGLLHHGRAWVALPDVEWRLMEPLVEHMGELVRRDELTQAGWPGRTVAASALNVRIKKARKRLEPLGLQIMTVRGRGYVLAPGT